MPIVDLTPSIHSRPSKPVTLQRGANPHRHKHCNTGAALSSFLVSTTPGTSSMRLNVLKFPSTVPPPPSQLDPQKSTFRQLDDPAFSADPKTHPYFVTSHEITWVNPPGHPPILNTSRPKPSSSTTAPSHYLVTDRHFLPPQPPNSPMSTDGTGGPFSFSTSNTPPRSFPLNPPPSASMPQNRFPEGLSHPGSHIHTAPAHKDTKKLTGFLLRRKETTEPPKPATSISQAQQSRQKPTQDSRPPATRFFSSPSVHRELERPSLSVRPATTAEDTPTASAMRQADGRRHISPDLDRIDELDETNPLGMHMHHGGPYEAISRVIRDNRNASQNLVQAPQMRTYTFEANGTTHVYTPHQPTPISLNLSPGQILTNDYRTFNSVSSPLRPSHKISKSLPQAQPISALQIQIQDASRSALSIGQIPNPQELSHIPAASIDNENAVEPPTSESRNRKLIRQGQGQIDPESINTQLGMAMMGLSSELRLSPIDSETAVDSTSQKDVEYNPYDPVHLHNSNSRDDYRLELNLPLDPLDIEPMNPVNSQEQDRRRLAAGSPVSITRQVSQLRVVNGGTPPPYDESSPIVVSSPEETYQRISIPVPSQLQLAQLQSLQRNMNHHHSEQIIIPKNGQIKPQQDSLPSNNRNIDRPRSQQILTQPGPPGQLFRPNMPTYQAPPHPAPPPSRADYNPDARSVQQSTRSGSAASKIHGGQPHKPHYMPKRLVMPAPLQQSTAATISSQVQSRRNSVAATPLHQVRFQPQTLYPSYPSRPPSPQKSATLGQFHAPRAQDIPISGSRKLQKRSSLLGVFRSQEPPAVATLSISSISDVPHLMHPVSADSRPTRSKTEKNTKRVLSKKKT